MSDTMNNEYYPDSVSPPGETLEETLEALGMTQVELAERMNRPLKTINEIIRGKAIITPATSIQLEMVLGIPASFWNNREQAYREYLARQAANSNFADFITWAQRFPLKTMSELGWITTQYSEVNWVREILAFFGVASPDAWDDIWGQPEVSFRRSQAFASNPYAVAAWLRQGEVAARQIECAPYDQKAFRAAIEAIKPFTMYRPKHFVAQVRELCAQAGVALVFVPELPESRVCGATRWLHPNKALLQLSFRYRTNDHLWFSFFHEAGHILCHGKRQIFIEGTEREESDDERAADKFAEDTLISPGKYRQLRDMRSITAADIARYACILKIHKAIILGRLQHDNLVPVNRYNDMKYTLDPSEFDNL